MNGRFRPVLALLLIGQALLALWALDVVDLVRGAGERSFVPAEVAPSGAPIDVETGEAIARQHAIGWSSAARLISVVMRLEWPSGAESPDQIQLPESGWLVYTYAAGDETLSIYLDRRTGFYITHATSNYGDESQPEIDLSQYVRGSTTAALTAEVLHGASYRSACPDMRRTALVTPSRIVDGNGNVAPIWVVTYADSRFTGDFDVLVQLDATNGNVIKSELTERPCAG
jgi:hypothetical protein